MTALVSFDRVSKCSTSRDRREARRRRSEARPAEVSFEHVDFATRPERCRWRRSSPCVMERTGVSILFDVCFVPSPASSWLWWTVRSGQDDHKHLAAPLRRQKRGGAHKRYDVRDVTLSSLQSVVGVVTQDAHLFHDTIRANLLYARHEASEADLIEALRTPRSGHGQLATGRLDTLVGTGLRLSGGRTARRHRRLLLKAPTSSCSTSHGAPRLGVRGAVQRALKKVLAGRTSIVIAHACPRCDADQILVVDAATS